MNAKNYILKNVCLVLFLLSISTITNGQGSIKTPKNQTVYVVTNWDTPDYLALWESQAANWI